MTSTYVLLYLLIGLAYHISFPLIEKEKTLNLLSGFFGQKHKPVSKISGIKY